MNAPDEVPMKEYSFQSRSTPGVHYTTVLHDDNRVTCNCPGYTRRAVRECVHTKDVMTQNHLVKAETPMAPKVQALFDAPVGFVSPMLASGTDDETPDDYSGPEWVAEEKFDGHRLIVRVTRDEVFAWSRVGNQRALAVTLSRSLSRLAEGVYDGELVIPGGTSTDVKALHLVNTSRFVLFDILKVAANGVDHSVMHLPAVERRRLLETAISRLDSNDVFTATQHRPSTALLKRVWADGGEGLIVKKLNAVYEAGKRSKAWLKFKKLGYAQLTITGFEEGKLGPHSKIKLRDAAGIEITVKTLNDYWRAVFAAQAKSFIGKTLSISYQERTRDGKYRHPMADHFPNGEL